MGKFEISKNAFAIVEESEGIEDFVFDNNSVKSNSEELMSNLDKRTILEFLRCEDTSIFVQMQGDEISLFASNSVSNETVKITGLGDHFLGLVYMVKMAENTVNQRQIEPSAPLITNELVKTINLKILQRREGEIAIGDYRDVDFFGDPVDVYIGYKEEGVLKTIECVDFEKSNDKQIFKKMDELIDWVNNSAFRNSEKIMEDIA